MTVVYGDDDPSYATLKHFAAEFCQGRTNLKIRPGYDAHLKPSMTNCQAVENVIMRNDGISIDDSWHYGH